ncbi:zinc finger lsd1 subclass domain-containing protein [Cystoisospora suis]|uniref:Zinc finger lsd1 subclass domain-containing protein n=1 Tax=Cystoisospora suis TaxID=483139 RepID=A0A2C6KLJ1_9APIC|nr:zinc finger lsd1 subclass domain-containing protein [Cystoisospora suis]
MSATEEPSEAEESGKDKNPDSAPTSLPAESNTGTPSSSHRSHASSVTARTGGSVSTGTASSDSARSSGKKVNRRKERRTKAEEEEASRNEESTQERGQTSEGGEKSRDEEEDDEEEYDDGSSWTQSVSSSPSRESDFDESESSSSEEDVTGPPQLRCHRCEQIMEFDPGSSFVQCYRCSAVNFVLPQEDGEEVHEGGKVLGVICPSCLTTNLTPFNKRLVRCGVCGTLSLVSPPVEEKTDKKGRYAKEARQTAKFAGDDGVFSDADGLERSKSSKRSRRPSGLRTNSTSSMIGCEGEDLNSSDLLEPTESEFSQKVRHETSEGREKEIKRRDRRKHKSSVHR